MRVVKAADLGDAVADFPPARTDALSQLLAELGLEDVARRLGVFVDRRVVEAGPLAVRPLGGVGDEGVDVNLGIAIPRRAMAVASGEEAVAPDELGVGPAPRPASLPLEVAEGSIEGSVECGGHGGAGLRVAQGPKQGGRLGDREGEIEAGNRAAPADGAQAQRLAGRRVAAGQHRRQLVGLDRAVEAQVFGRVAEPLTLGLALAGVVVLSAFGDLVEVVALLSYAELANREHPPRLSSGRRFCPGQFRN